MVTTLSALSSMLTIIFIYDLNKPLAMLFATLRFYFDCCDGHLARKTGQVTEFGDIYDHFVDWSYATAFTYMIWIKSDNVSLNMFIWFGSILVALVGHACYMQSLDNKVDKQGREVLSLLESPAVCFGKQSIARIGFSATLAAVLFIIYNFNS